MQTDISDPSIMRSFFAPGDDSIASEIPDVPVHAMEEYWRSRDELQFRLFLTSTLDGGERSTSRPGRFTPLIELRYALDRRLGGPQRRS